MPDPETGQPDPEKLMAFIGEHPETAKALQLGLPAAGADAQLRHLRATTASTPSRS